MPKQIQGSQHDFSFGAVDVALKRSDDHPARKGGLRQMENARILNSRGVQNRPGRRALYPVTNSGLRTERFTISSGNVYDIQFAAGRVKIIDSVGATVGNFTTKGGGGALPWTAGDLNTIVYAIFNKSIYITFGHSMRPQVITWDGVATWAIADYAEQTIGGATNQKRTPFYRISPQGITIKPSATTGVGITLTASSALFTAAWVGTRIRWVNRQILITAFTSSTLVTATVEEALPPSQRVDLTSDPSVVYNLGDAVVGSVSGSRGVVVGFPGPLTMHIQLTSLTTSTVETATNKFFAAVSTVYAFIGADYVAGPGGALGCTSVSVVQPPEAVAVWDDEVMNDFRGYPGSCFVDQFRLGFCDFPSVPGGIGWSTINSPADLYVGPNPPDAMFEIAPDKTRVLYVLAGAESSEFIFCEDKLYYIKIDPSNPLKPGSVSFQTLSDDGCAQVQPRRAQEAIVYVNAGRTSVMAIIAPGSYYRPFNTKSLTEFHSHLFSNVVALAVPNADGTFEERYAYALNADGSVVIGKYEIKEGQLGVAVGWGPWSSVGTVSWIAAHGADVVFTSSYFGSAVVEVVDDAHYLDCALLVNALPAAFAAPVGKGPLWFIPSQTVTLIDQATRYMGPYAIDADGFIIPQFLGGEDLTLASLVAGQMWNMTVEPFAPNAQSGADVHQRMMKRRISNFAAYVVNSTGFTLQKLFSRKQTLTSPALGTPVAIKRVGMWNVGQDSNLPPTQRETVETWRPSGHSFDPRVALIKDTPGPLVIVEVGMEVTL